MSRIVFVLETTHRESGKTTRQEFTTPEDRMAAFSHVDVHAYSYRLEEVGERGAA